MNLGLGMFLLRVPSSSYVHFFSAFRGFVFVFV